MAVAVLGAGFWFALVGCGLAGSHASERRSNDQTSVASAELVLWDEVDTRSGSHAFGATQEVVSALKRARSDGVSRAWLNQEISDAEDAVSYAPGGCDRCRTILEDAR